MTQGNRDQYIIILSQSSISPMSLLRPLRAFRPLRSVRNLSQISISRPLIRDNKLPGNFSSTPFNCSLILDQTRRSIVADQTSTFTTSRSDSIAMASEAPQLKYIDVGPHAILRSTTPSNKLFRSVSTSQTPYSGASITAPNAMRTTSKTSSNEPSTLAARNSW
jgi:hypothetical protein